MIRIFADSDRGEDASADGVAANTSRITVEDNGLGFEAQYAERIFGIFQRLHGRGRYEGTGVGLAICLRIAERHGGTITATGRPGQGATFTVNLKTRQDSSSPSAAETGIAA